MPGDLLVEELSAKFAVLVPHLDERQRRLHGRGDVHTAEENRLQQDDAFRRRMLDGYAALGVRHVDATGTVDDIVAVIVEQVDAWRRTPSRVPQANEAGSIDATGDARRRVS